MFKVKLPDKVSYWFNAIFFVLAQRLSIMVAGLIIFLILLRILDKDIMGIYVLYFTIITVFEVTRDGLIKNATIRYIRLSDKINSNLIQTTALLFNLIYSVLFAFIIVLFADKLSSIWDIKELAHVLKIYSIAAIISILFSHFEYILQAKLLFKKIFILYATKQFSYLLLIILYSTYSEKSIILEDIIILHLSAILFSTVIGFFITRKYLLTNLKFRCNNIKIFWQYGRFVLFTNICSQALRTADHFLLISFLSSPAVAIYNVSVRIANLLDMPAKAVTEALFPKSVVSKNDGKSEIAKLYEQTTGGIIAILIPICIFIFIFPEIIILLLAGEKYMDAAPILRITALYSILLPFQKQFGTVMDATGRPHINFLVNLLLAIVNIASVYLFIKKFGVIGASYGLLSTLFVAFLISQSILNKYYNVSQIKILKNAYQFYATLFKVLNKKIIST